MKENSKTIAVELKQLERRQAELSADVANAKRELETARQGLISGQADAQQVTSAQSTFHALSEALIMLDARITKRRAEAEEASREAERTADLARASEIEKERARLTEEIQSLYERGNQELAEIVSASMEKMKQFSELGREADAIHFQLHGTDRSPHRSDQGLRLRAVTPYGEAVDVAVAIETRRLKRERLKELSREQRERRLERENSFVIQ
jgi:multidrug efflux pump subunit AcrA (membrane-fusion protein)